MIIQSKESEQNHKKSRRRNEYPLSPGPDSLYIDALSAIWLQKVSATKQNSICLRHRSKESVSIKEKKSTSAIHHLDSLCRQKRRLADTHFYLSQLGLYKLLIYIKRYHIVTTAGIKTNKISFLVKEYTVLQTCIQRQNIYLSNVQIYISNITFLYKYYKRQRSLTFKSKFYLNK